MRYSLKKVWNTHMIHHPQILKLDNYLSLYQSFEMGRGSSFDEYYIVKHYLFQDFL